MLVIGPFKGEYRWLSNFSPVEIKFENRIFPSVEHAYQAAKTHVFLKQEEIRTAKTPADAKRLGNEVELREDWEDVKLNIMRILIQRKFKRGTVLAKKLRRTKKAALIEFNTWHDRFWGRCTCHKCKGKGKNHLGKLLMEQRAKLKGESK